MLFEQFASSVVDMDRVCLDLPNRKYLHLIAPSKTRIYIKQPNFSWQVKKQFKLHKREYLYVLQKFNKKIAWT
jgi:hypothetical protein